jgi:hypothetical protein
MKQFIKWLVIIVVYILLTNLFTEYIVSRPINPLLQFLGILIYIFITAGVLRYAILTLIKYLKSIFL